MGFVKWCIEHQINLLKDNLLMRCLVIGCIGCDLSNAQYCYMKLGHSMGKIFEYASGPFCIRHIQAFDMHVSFSTHLWKIPNIHTCICKHIGHIIACGKLVRNRTLDKLYFAVQDVTLWFYVLVNDDSLFLFILCTIVWHQIWTFMLYVLWIVTDFAPSNYLSKCWLSIYRCDSTIFNRIIVWMIWDKFDFICKWD